MKRLIVALAISIAIPCAAQSTFDVVERPELKPGDSWSFLVSVVVPSGDWKFTRQIESKAEKNYVAKMTVENASGLRTSSAMYSFDLNRLSVVNGEVTDSGWLQFPLTPGKTWKAKEQWANQNGYGYEELTYKAVGAEKVTVPAGTFDTIKVEGSGGWVNNQWNTNNRTEAEFWYAPKVKAFVRFHQKRWFRTNVDSESVTELVRFNVDSDPAVGAK